MYDTIFIDEFVGMNRTAEVLDVLMNTLCC